MGESTVLVTGCAGFIGSHLCQTLLNLNYKVVGLDNLNNYYDSKLKHDRLRQLNRENFTFVRADLTNASKLRKIFKAHHFSIVINLAAQAGVRYSIENPASYTSSNLVGFSELLECCRRHGTSHLIYASSSSVYGISNDIPFSTTNNVDHPVSFYAATKKANELMAHSYSHLYGMRTTGLRFFTVYGPWGRPDMAYFSFTQSILAGRPIKVFNSGNMLRDFTYIDDIVDGIEGLMRSDFSDDEQEQYPGRSKFYRIYNIGNNNPVRLDTFIATLEELLGKTAEKIYLPMQDGDVPTTYADITALASVTGYQPSTDIRNGLGKFVSWYKDYYGENNG